MAEAVAIVGLVGAIASLIDLTTKVVSRLHEFSSKSSAIPDSFRSLSTRLALLTLTLQHVRAQAEAGHLVENERKALINITNDTSEQVLAIQTYLSKSLPADGASKLDRGLKAMKSLAKEDKVQRVMQRIDQNNDILRLYQTTRHVDTGDIILGRLTELITISKSPSESFGKDEFLSLAQASVKTVLEECPPQTQSIFSTSSRGLQCRFLQLPIEAQERFIAQHEKQLRNFVEQEEAKVLEFWNAFDSRQRLADQGRHRVEGSCDWILRSPEYLDWVQGKVNRLQLLAGPGFGKTLLSAFLAEALNDRLGNEDILAVYACFLSDPVTTSAISILSAIAGQIAKCSTTSMEKCKKFLERFGSEGQLNPGVLDFQDLVVEMSLSADIQHIFIVIDGLDEVEWEQPGHLTAIIDIPQRARKVKMLVTSRRNPLIMEALQGYSTLSTENVTIKTDLAAMIKMELRCSELANLPQQELDEIEEMIVRKSDGSFLQARMTISLLSEYFRDHYTFQQAKDAVFHGLPTSLKELYDMKMLTIQANSSVADVYAVKVYLYTLARHNVTLSVTELHEAAIREHPNLPCYTPEELVEQAQGLLRRDPKAGNLRFIHLSARDYVLSHPVIGDCRDSP